MTVVYLYKRELQIQMDSWLYHLLNYIIFTYVLVLYSELQTYTLLCYYWSDQDINYLYLLIKAQDWFRQTVHQVILGHHNEQAAGSTTNTVYINNF